jgi:hypothetical protein
MKGRITVEEELEKTLGKPKFDAHLITRGQSRGVTSMFSSGHVANNI